MNKSNVLEVKQKINEQITIKRPKLKSKRITGIIAPPILWLGMLFTYQIYGLVFGREIGWYLGLFTYWMICGLLFSSYLIGIKRIKELSAPRKLNLKMIPVIIFPVVMAFLFSLISGIEYSKVNLVGIVCLIMTTFGNGIFEEILWRGVYMELYPKSNFMRVGYSTFWYAVFHFASGSLSSSGNILGLVIGSAFFGIYLSLLAKW